MYYNYTCSCGNEKEIEHSMTETPEIICDKCQSQMKIKITIGHGGVHFKGDGFTKSNT